MLTVNLRRLRHSVVGILLVSATFHAREAQASPITYAYTGNSYTFVQGFYDVSMRVTVSLIFATPLAANSVLSPLDWSNLLSATLATDSRRLSEIVPMISTSPRWVFALVLTPMSLSTNGICLRRH